MGPPERLLFTVIQLFCTSTRDSMTLNIPSDDSRGNGGGQKRPVPPKGSENEAKMRLLKLGSLRGR